MKVKSYAQSFAVLASLYFFAVLCLFASGNNEQAPVVLVNDQGYNEMTKDKVVFRWKVEGVNLLVDVTAPTTGWVGVGFDPSFWMKDANLIIGYVKNNQAFIEDDFGTDNTAHQHDTNLGGQDNILSKDGQEQNGTTELRFTIPLNSGDKYDKVLEPGKEYTVLVAYGANDVDDMMTHHAYRNNTLKIKL